MNTQSTDKPAVIAPPAKLPWYRNLGMQVLVSLVLGIAVGLAFPGFAGQLKLLGDMFLSLIKAGVAPLVFLTIVHGIASAGDLKSAGRVGWRSIVYFEVVSTIALIVGLLAGNLLELGSHMNDTHSLRTTSGRATVGPYHAQGRAGLLDSQKEEMSSTAKLRRRVV